MYSLPIYSFNFRYNIVTSWHRISLVCECDREIEYVFLWSSFQNLFAVFWWMGCPRLTGSQTEVPEVEVRCHQGHLAGGAIAQFLIYDAKLNERTHLQIIG
jgi:hypothetical protein